MHSQADIINLALANLSNLNLVQDSGENSPEAEQALRHWEICFDAALAEYPWPWATASVVLAQLAGEEEGTYAYPADCVKIQRLHRPGGDAGLPFRVGRSGGMRVIRSSGPPVAADYTTRDIPCPDLPADFTAALAWRLAAEIALAQRADPQLADNATRAYLIHLERAKLRDAAETGPRKQARYKWEEARNLQNLKS